MSYLFIDEWLNIEFELRNYREVVGDYQDWELWRFLYSAVRE